MAPPSAGREDDFALLMLESPWWSPRDNPTRASCLPFFEGLERLSDGFNIYYSTFYDTSGFETALSQDLIHTAEKRQILYIGAHGAQSSIADGRASTILGKVRQHGRRIGGVIISSCYVAGNVDNVLKVLIESKISWVFGYTRAVSWMGSLLLELAIVKSLIGTDEHVDGDEDLLIGIFAEALRKFNPNASFGAEDEPLSDCIRLAQRAKFKHHPTDLTEKMCEEAWG